MGLSEPKAEIIVCQGPPVCLLIGNEAIEAARNGCPWCEHILIDEDETETVVKRPIKC